METVPRLIAAKDRNGRFSGYYRCSNCTAEFRPNPEDPGELRKTFAAHVRLSHSTDCADTLKTLETLIELTIEAEELASDIEKSERLRLLVVDIRRNARAENERLKTDRQPQESQYQLCITVILEECNFGRVAWPNVTGLESRLRRIHQEIDRTIQTIKANRAIM